MKSVNTLFPKLPKGKFFRKGTSLEESAELEESFLKALGEEIAC